MNKRSSHASKSTYEKARYQAYLKDISPEPTLRKSLDFDPSTKLGEELSVSTSKRKRKIPVTQTFMNFISEHWSQVILTIFGIVLVYLVFDAKANFPVIDTKITYLQQQMDKLDTSINNQLVEQQEQIDNLNTSVDEHTDIHNALNILVNELKLRIEFIENQLNNK